MTPFREPLAYGLFGLFSLLLVSFTPYLPAHAAPSLTMGDAIDKAGRQRMLTQRMIKAYALAGMDLKLDAGVELNAAADLFNTQLAELTAFAATPEERAQIDKITLLWNDLRPEFDAAPNVDRGGELNDLAELLLRESHQLVLMLEKRSGTVAGKLVNMSGRQRMLSQRIAKIYLLQTWGLGSGVLEKHYNDAVRDFDQALAALQAAQINTTEIASALGEVEKNWRIFGISHFSQKYDTRVPWLVVRSMDRILGQMNTITGMYAKLH